MFTRNSKILWDRGLGAPNPQPERKIIYCKKSNTSLWFCQSSQKCKKLLLSCIFGSSDFLRRPTSEQMSEFSKKNVCFVMFVDQPTQSTSASEGNVPNDNGNISLWRIIVVKNLPYKDMRRTLGRCQNSCLTLFPSSSSLSLDTPYGLTTQTPCSLSSTFYVEQGQSMPFLTIMSATARGRKFSRISISTNTTTCPLMNSLCFINRMA
ncbi:hypothetical protein SAY86_018306 [Trapa natans]|uniref:TOD1/MUCI70 glycosyltransferase-like domain-containing protein n=1 Tax=Trapa natans TaxID=22666 RepID=A0AAN7LIV6_TRANT|nr:hypothetical protein SAY86_018306 [Trapa natans]